MRSLRRQLIAVALAAFAAGAAFGLAVQSSASAWSRPVDGEHADFVARFRDRYGLNQEQVRDLRAVLLRRDDDLMKIAKGFDVEKWPPQAQSQLVAAQRKMERRIEELLDEDQRARYRRDVRGDDGATQR